MFKKKGQQPYYHKAEKKRRNQIRMKKNGKKEMVSSKNKQKIKKNKTKYILRVIFLLQSQYLDKRAGDFKIIGKLKLKKNNFLFV